MGKIQYMSHNFISAKQRDFFLFYFFSELWFINYLHIIPCYIYDSEFTCEIVFSDHNLIDFSA